MMDLLPKYRQACRNIGNGKFFAGQFRVLLLQKKPFLKMTLVELTTAFQLRQGTCFLREVDLLRKSGIAGPAQ
jgi:hypothetical protein